MSIRKISSTITAFALAVSFCACATPSGNDGSSLEALIEKTNVIGSTSIVAKDELIAVETDDAIGFQTELPQKDEEIAIITTSKGVMKLRFFPAQAPKTVYNFKKLAYDGYYDGIIFHRVFDNFMVQTGDPTGTGMGGESVWGESFEDEFSEQLYNIKGSVAMANIGVKSTNGSQIFVNTNDSKTSIISNAAGFNEFYNENVDVLVDLYKEYGGNSHLDGALRADGLGHTVFAQVFEGVDVAEKISKVFADEKGKPQEDVVIESIEIVKYEG